MSIDTVSNLTMTIKGADIYSFGILSGFYTIDKENVYYRGIPLEGADTNTFKVIIDLEAKNKNDTYKSGKIVK